MDQNKRQEQPARKDSVLDESPMEFNPTQEIARQTHASRLATKVATRPRSAYELRAHYKNGSSGPSKPLEVRRKGVVESPVGNSNSLLEDATILGISAGPYASVGVGGSENRRPSIAMLPAMSSSEWLGGGGGKKKGQIRKASSMNPVIQRQKEGSPGQRMVTGWLDERRGKERRGEGGAFV